MKLLVTAGPTREFFDPVRYISNRSSGKMGCAIAEAALRRGHSVTLVLGPVAHQPPAGAEIVNVVSALDMLAAVEAHLEGCDALVAAAAVADWRPAEYSPKKMKKISAAHAGANADADAGDGIAAANTTDAGAAAPRARAVELIPNPDILATIAPRKGSRIFVGFAAETNDLVTEAAAKLARKSLDMIVANDITRPGSGFDVDTNEVIFLAPGAPPECLPLLSKAEVADRIVRRIEQLKSC